MKKTKAEATMTKYGPHVALNCSLQIYTLQQRLYRVRNIQKITTESTASKLQISCISPSLLLVEKNFEMLRLTALAVGDEE